MVSSVAVQGVLAQVIPQALALTSLAGAAVAKRRVRPGVRGASRARATHRKSTVMIARWSARRERGGRGEQASTHGEPKERPGWSGRVRAEIITACLLRPKMLSPFLDLTSIVITMLYIDTAPYTVRTRPSSLRQLLQLQLLPDLSSLDCAVTPTAKDRSRTLR